MTQLELVEGLLPKVSSKIREMKDVDTNLVLIVPETNIEKVKSDGAYVCQNERTFRSTKYIAFYNKGVIRTIAEIVSIQDNVDMNDPEVLIKDPTNKYLHLKENDTLRTIVNITRVVDINVVNNITSPKSGKIVAFVQGQRYVSFIKLANASTTSELI